MPGLFFLDTDRRDIDYENLPPLVRKGADREAILESIITGWCTPTGIDPEKDLESHIAAGGCCVEKVRFWDANTDDPIDLGDLLRRVEGRLLEAGEPEEFQNRSDLYILIRECLVNQCKADRAFVRPRLWTATVQFSNEVSFQEATFGDSARFSDATFGGSANFGYAAFGKSAGFFNTTFGNAANFVRAAFGESASFFNTTFGNSAKFIRGTFGDSADFCYATFGDSADFSNTTFSSSADFSGATFGDSASFGYATFGDSASFSEATYGDSARFSGATFGKFTSFVRATLGDSASFLGATFGKDACFQYARLPDADFGDANLANADLNEARLEMADLRGVHGLLFDDNYVRDIRIEGNAPDPWSVLRRTYSGPRYFLHLLLLIAFFTPYAAKAVYYTYLSRFQQNMLNRVARLRTQIEHTPALAGDGLALTLDIPFADLRTDLNNLVADSQLPPPLRTQLAEIVNKWPASQSASDPPRPLRLHDLTMLSAKLEWTFYERHRAVPAIQQFLTGGLGRFGFALAAIAILYNALRLALTLQVSQLREAEERSSVTPRLVEYYGQCHPRADKEKIGRTLWAACWLWFWEHFTRWNAPRECDEDVHITAWPDSLRRLRQSNWAKRVLRKIGLCTDDCKRPYSLLECIGLYRVHLFAAFLLYVTLLATAWNLLNWIASTWIWIPKDVA